MGYEVGFNDHFPRTPAMPRYHDPPARDCVPPKTLRMLEHMPQVDLCKTTIEHALEEMRTEFQFPVPPSGPMLPGQSPPPDRSSWTERSQASALANVVLTGAGHETSGNSAPYHRVRLKTQLAI
jgi:hypothetical protein